MLLEPLFTPVAGVPYRHYHEAKASLYGLLAIDFYLANDLCALLARAEHSEQARTLLWHSVVLVNQCLRDGHSCADLTVLGGSLWGQIHTAEQSCAGYRFAPADDWRAQLAAFGLAPEQGQPLVLEGTRLYLRRYWQFEQQVAQGLGCRLSSLPVRALGDQTALLAQLFPPRENAAAPDYQRLAVEKALGRRFSVITGGPGTGKTTTVTRLLYALCHAHQQQTPEGALRIRMAAPTGKAAQRLVESIRASKQALQQQGLSAPLLAQIPEQAATLHRLLGVIPGSLQFRHDQSHPLALDVLLVDEFSMVDLPMMARLLRALPPAARLILLGDADQLPSVAAGSLLAELARPWAGQTPPYLAQLVHSYRFNDQGGIGRLARAVIEGQADAAWQQVSAADKADQAVSLADASGNFDAWLDALVQTHYRHMFEVATPEAAFERLAQFRILCSHRTGHRGVVAINARIEQALAREGLTSDGPWYAGRPLMVTENHYGLGLFNGDIGLVWRHAGRLMAAFWTTDGPAATPALRWLHLAQLPATETVFAMTIHKTQGSEYDRVALVLPDDDSPLLSRELLYTGITRAKSSVCIWSTEAIFKHTVQRQVRRYAGLGEALAKMPDLCRNSED